MFPSQAFTTLSSSPDQQETLRQLRESLAGRFPGAHAPLSALATSPEGAQADQEAQAPPDAFTITHPHFSSPLFLHKGEVTEAHGDLGSASLLLESILRSTAKAHSFMALVDASSGFDPTLPPAHLSRLLWVMAQNVAAALKATDLFLRDGNLPLILLDLQLSPPEELRRIPSSTWYRFQRILEPTGVALLVLTPRPMISSAARRITMKSAWNLQVMHQRRDRLPLEIHPSHRRHQPYQSHPVSADWRQSA